MKINSDGIIVGGVCDKIHHQRAARERGAEIYLQTLIDKICISSNNGWLRITHLPKIKEEEIYHIGAVHGSDVEVGYIRFRNDVIERLHQQKKSFRKGWLEKWLEDICSFELDVEVAVARDPHNPLAILEVFSGNKEVCRFGYAEPHQDALYKKRKVRGDFIK